MLDGWLPFANGWNTRRCKMDGSLKVALLSVISELLFEKEREKKTAKKKRKVAVLCDGYVKYLF